MLSVNRGNKSLNYTLPAPIGGLNVRDSLDAMKENDAIVMDNYIPMDTKVALRKGYSLYQNFLERVETLAEFIDSQYPRFIAISGGKFYDISTIEEKVEITGATLKNSEAQFFQYKNHLFFMNGLDIPKDFTVAETGENSLKDWSFKKKQEVTYDFYPEKMISGAVSKNFVWFIEKGTLHAWHTTTAGDISGDLACFDLSGIAKKGGSLVAIANWTQDGGQGIDDLTVFITSEGEALVYSGANPNTADTWTLKGSYTISKPIGYKCTIQYQGDIVIISEDGYIPLSKALPLEQANSSLIAFSDKIRGLVLERTQNNSKKQGWQGIIYSRGGYAIFNVPLSRQFEQHVININTGAWCRFCDIRSWCWGLFQGRIYFGSDKAVYLFDDGYSDNGVQIKGEVQQAFSMLGNNSIKRIQLLNPRTRSATEYKLVLFVNMDFADDKEKYEISIGESRRSQWNKVKWSSSKNPIGTKWSTSKGRIRNQWIPTSAVGFSASLVFKTETKGNLIEWYDTGVRYEVGQGII